MAFTVVPPAGIEPATHGLAGMARVGHPDAMKVGGWRGRLDDVEGYWCREPDV